MGWRSWNCYGGNVNQTKMTGTMDRMAARTRLVNGKKTSLLDLGYNNCGLDDNWQACGTDLLPVHAASSCTVCVHPPLCTHAIPSLNPFPARGVHL